MPEKIKIILDQSETVIKIDNFEIVVFHFEEDSQEAKELTKFIAEALKNKNP